MPKRDESYMRGRRDHIVHAALNCIQRTGLAGFSTTAVCREAGISMGALYTHFATKEDILYAIAERNVEERRSIYNFQTREEMRDRLLERVVDAAGLIVQQKLRVDLEILLSGLADERLARLWRPRNDSRDLSNSIERLVRVGELRAGIDADAAAFALESLIFGAAYRRLTGVDTAAAAHTAMVFLLDAMAPASAPSSSIAAPSDIDS